MYIHPVPPVLNETRALVMMYNDFYRQAIQDLQGNVHPPPAPVCHPVVPFLGLTPSITVYRCEHRLVGFRRRLGHGPLDRASGVADDRRRADGGSVGGSIDVTREVPSRRHALVAAVPGVARGQFESFASSANGRGRVRFRVHSGGVYDGCQGYAVVLVVLVRSQVIALGRHSVTGGFPCPSRGACCGGFAVHSCN